MTYNDLKQFEDRKYSGMPIGGIHNWSYPDGKWQEQKITPEEWRFKFTCRKERLIPAPENSGAKLGTRYHWFILADQRVIKVDKDSYQTVMEGAKYKLGHKRPHWRGWSYEYPEQLSYRQRLIQILKDTLLRLEEEEARAQEGEIIRVVETSQ